MDICVADGAAPVTVDNIVPLRSDGIQMLGWGIRKLVGAAAYRVRSVGAGRGRIADLPSFNHTTPVGPCTRGPTVQVEVNIRPTKPVSSVAGFGVQSGKYQLNMPFSIQLCAHRCPASG